LTEINDPARGGPILAEIVARPPGRAGRGGETVMSLDVQQTIRARAYALWEKEGRPSGHTLTHWLRAEEEAIRAGVYGVLDDGSVVEPGACAPFPSRTWRR